MAKILENARRAHEERQNGVIRVPAVPTTKVTKKKKVKKSKGMMSVDVTIAFKGADGHVEEIVVKDKPKKKKGIGKKKVKKSLNKPDDNTEDKKESTEEDTESMLDSENLMEAQPEKALEALRKL